MNGLLEIAFNEAQSKNIGARAEEDAVLDLAFAEDDVVVGLAADSGQLLFRRIQRLRFRKTAAFLAISIGAADVVRAVFSIAAGHRIDEFRV